VPQIMEAQPVQAELPDRRPPDQPAEVAALQVGAPAAPEHQPIQLRRGEVVQVLSQRSHSDRREDNHPLPGGRLGRRDDELAGDLGHLLDHMDAGTGQVDAAASLSKGSRVVVMGRLQQRAWTAEDGSARSVVEVVADELGPSLRWATAMTTRATRSQSQ
jgi:Single-strand binding protein family